ncbi:MAG TPA: hypothetical protein VEZ43_04535 [Dongiaceae bacterium]|nr:hypothetical protein [Dongiaceae bacterium]
MRSGELRRLLNSEVVGQLNNGLFFEGHVEDNAGKASIFDRDGRPPRRISPTRVKWLTKAVRYC